MAALLWEIKRLRDLLATIAAHLGELRHDEPVHRAYFHERLQDLLETERVRFDPGKVKATRLYGWKPERGPVAGHAERRAQQVREENEREEKRPAPEGRRRQSGKASCR